LGNGDRFDVYRGNAMHAELDDVGSKINDNNNSIAIIVLRYGLLSM
jgi:hypothetical protein